VDCGTAASLLRQFAECRLVKVTMQFELYVIRKKKKKVKLQAQRNPGKIPGLMISPGAERTMSTRLSRCSMWAVKPHSASNRSKVEQQVQHEH
jgi:hypothetical protein